MAQSAPVYTERFIDLEKRQTHSDDDDDDNNDDDDGDVRNW